MDWLYTRRGPEWKQGWRGQTVASISMPPLPLLAIFGIVIFLLSISQSASYKEQLQRASMNVQLVLLLVPILLILLLRPSFTGGWFNFWAPKRGREEYSSMQRSSGGGFPWGVAILLVALVVLVSYQSSFHSKWFAGNL